MTRDEERLARAQQEPLVGSLPDVPGILASMLLTPGLGVHLRGLADEILVRDFPGATISREERELLATAVSAANDCFYCMDSHGAFAAALIERSSSPERTPVIEEIKVGSLDGLDAKMHALVHVARTVRRGGLELSSGDVDAAVAAGASDGDVQLAVIIAAAFSMFNRLVDGFRAKTPPSAEAYRARATEIAERGYSDGRVAPASR